MIEIDWNQWEGIESAHPPYKMENKEEFERYQLIAVFDILFFFLFFLNKFVSLGNEEGEDREILPMIVYC